MTVGINNKRKTAVLALAIMGYLANPVYAAEADNSETLKTRDVVVSATRTEQEIKETPASVEVITREDIEKMGAETLAQALKTAVGIDVLENGMVGNTVSIRGMGSNRTLMMIDGRRIRTENTSETANNYELQRVNMDNVERIEIVRGPASSLYGSEALGGVINIITKRPDKEKTTVSLSSTSHQNDQSARIDFGKQGNWTWSMDARHVDVKSRNDDKDSSVTNQYGNKYYFNMDGRMDVAKDKYLDVFFDYMKEDLYSHDSAAQGTDYDHTRTTTGIAYSGKDKRGDYELRTYYTIFDKKQRTRNKTTGALSSFDNMKFNSWITDAKRTVQAGDNHLLTYGAEYRKEDYEGTRLGSGASNPVNVTLEGVTTAASKASNNYSAVYIQDEWKMNDKWLVIPSVRLDHSDSFGNKVTSKLGSTYKLSDYTRIKTNIGTAYRAPTASELYMNWEHKPTAAMTVNVQGNPNLRPETSMNYEISLEAEKDKRFGKLTFFRNDVDDLINLNSAFSYVPGSGMRVTSRYENVDKADIRGIEFEGGKHLSDHFTIKATHAFLDAKDGKTGQRLTGRAQNKTTLQLQYDDVKNSGISATLWNEWLNNYAYSQTTAGVSSIKNVDYSILNFVINKKINDKYRVYFGVDNITDKKVSELSIDGRIWRVGMTLTV